MRKRVSVKGKGADIFFGDYPAPPTEPNDDGPTEAPSPTGEPEAGTEPTEDASMQSGHGEAVPSASMHARTQEPRRSRRSSRPKRPAPQTGTEAGPLSLQSLLPFVSERATVTNAFRYTERELSWLTDAIYEVFKRYGAKLTKQEVARLGLAAVLLDYQERGDASLLAQLAARRKESGE